MAFILAVVSLVEISLEYGIGREDRFVVIVLSVNWLVLIVNGILFSILYRKQIGENEYENTKDLAE